MAYYVICDDDSKHESMTKEQILAAITQTIESGKVVDVDTGFVTKIKEQNGGRYVSFWVGTQAEYNALTERATNCLYIISDDTSVTELENCLQELTENVDANAAAVTELENCLQELTENVDANAAAVTDLDSKVSELEQTTDAYQQHISDAVKEHEAKITEQAAAISGLDDEVKEHDIDIKQLTARVAALEAAQSN